MNVRAENLWLFRAAVGIVIWLGQTGRDIGSASGLLSFAYAFSDQHDTNVIDNANDEQIKNPDGSEFIANKDASHDDSQSTDGHSPNSEDERPQESVDQYIEGYLGEDMKDMNFMFDMNDPDLKYDGLFEDLLSSFGRTLISLDDRLEKSIVEYNGPMGATSAVTMLGRRDSDEDALLVNANLASPTGVVLRGIFDGHGGTFTSRYCANQISQHLEGVPVESSAMTDAFLRLDEAILTHNRSSYAGSTGILVAIENIDTPTTFLLAGDEITNGGKTLEELLLEADGMANGKVDKSPVREVTLGGEENVAYKLTVANVGDSRALLLHPDGTFSQLSKDHKPADPEEEARIVNAGGFVQKYSAGIARVDGNLSLSRAFGDGDFKQSVDLNASEQKVIAVPDVHTFIARPGDILVMTCDGVFEPRDMNWMFVASFLSTALFELKVPLTEAAVKLVEQAYAQFSGDNISVLISEFQPIPNAVAKVNKYKIRNGNIVKNTDSHSNNEYEEYGKDPILPDGVYEGSDVPNPSILY